MVRKNDSQLELHPFDTVAEAEPPEREDNTEPQPKPEPKPEPKTEPKTELPIMTVEEYRQQEQELYAEGLVVAGTIKKAWRHLLPGMKRVQEFLSQRGINHVRGTRNCLKTWERWLADYLVETGINLNAHYVASQVVAYEPGLPEWHPSTDAVELAHPRSIRVQSGHRQSRKSNSSTVRSEEVETPPLRPGDGAALGARMVDTCGKGGAEVLQESSPDEVIDLLQEAFGFYAKSVRPNLKITVMVCVDPDDSDLDLDL